MTTSQPSNRAASPARREAEHLRELLDRERQGMADFLLALAAFDRARRWSDLGHASLWAFLHVDLGLSAGAAHWRKVAARLVHAFPAVEAGLRRGDLCLSSIVELSKVLTTENQAEVILRFQHLSSREAKELVAELAPATAFPTRERVTVAARPLRIAGAPSASPAPGPLRAPEAFAIQAIETTGLSPQEPAAPARDEHACPAADQPALSVEMPMAPPVPYRPQCVAGLPALFDAAQEIAAPPSASHLPLDAAEVEVEVEEPSAAAASATPLTLSFEAAPPLATSSPAPRTDTAPPGADPSDVGAVFRVPGSPPRRSPRPAVLPDDVVPLDGDLRRLHLTVPRRFIEKLAAARRARAHAQPGASSGEILEAALDLLLARDAVRRKAASKRPAVRRRSCAPGRVQASVRREVWRRDGGRCQWPLEGGGVCGSTWRLELDHVHPKARGGPSTTENLRLLCGPHNAEAARRTFGEAFMAGKSAGGAARPGQRQGSKPRHTRKHSA